MQLSEIIAIGALIITLMSIFFNIYNKLDNRLDALQNQVISLYQGLELMEGKINLASSSQAEFIGRVERKLGECKL